jgi:rRNA maturation endonuclease Nob1
MVMIAIAFITVCAIALVAYPYFKAPRELDVFSQSDPALENLIVQRDATYAGIKDLDFDYAMKKLSDSDYRSQRARMEMKAVGILRELDGMTEQANKRTRPSLSDEAIERQVQQLRGAAKTTRCAKCNTLAAAGDRFCAKCGSPIHRHTSTQGAA